MTDRHSVEALVRDTLAQLRLDLDGHHQVVDLSERGEQRIRGAIEWLLSVRHEEGYWGYRSPAVTATCTLAIALWRPVQADSLLRPSADWLLSQTHDGAWETTWDSGAAVAAAWVAGAGNDPRAQEAMRALMSQDPAGSAGRPHHGAQVLAAAQVGDWPPAKRERWCVQVAQDLEPPPDPTLPPYAAATSSPRSHRWRAGPYVLGQAVYGLLSASKPVADLRDELDHLAAFLEETPMSTAAFLDHAAALRALAHAGTHPDAVDRTIDEFFGSAYRRDGSWYHEPWYTAWGLLALHEASSVRRVVVEQPRLNDYLARADRVVEVVRSVETQRADAERRARLAVMAGTALLLAGVVGAGYAVFALPDSNRLFSSGLAVSLLLTVVAVAWRLLWPALHLRN